MSSSIPFNKASIGQQEFGNIARAVEDGHISGNGPFTKEAEELLQKIHSGSRSLLTTSCTHALELSARLLDLSPGDEVIVPAFTFVSTASAYVWNGARPVFADIRDDTLNMDLESAIDRMSSRTKAICLVHYAGVGADPRSFAKLCEDRGLTLIEDNAHGLGASYDGRNLGTFGSFSTLSFHETKNITCGEGGAIVLNDSNFIERAEILREKGTNRSALSRGAVSKYTWLENGSSWVPSDVLAAILVAQLARLDEITRRRTSIWDRYQSELHDWALSNDVRLPAIPEAAQHPAHIFHLRLPSEAQRSAFIDFLRGYGIHAVFHYQSLNNSPAGRQAAPSYQACPVAEHVSETLVRLPLYTNLTNDQVDHIVETVQRFQT